MSRTIPVPADTLRALHRWIEGRLLAENGDLPTGYDIGQMEGMRLREALADWIAMPDDPEMGYRDIAIKALEINDRLFAVIDTLKQLRVEVVPPTMASTNDFRTKIIRQLHDLRDERCTDCGGTLEDLIRAGAMPTCTPRHWVEVGSYIEGRRVTSLVRDHNQLINISLYEPVDIPQAPPPSSQSS